MLAIARRKTSRLLRPSTSSSNSSASSRSRRASRYSRVSSTSKLGIAATLDHRQRRTGRQLLRDKLLHDCA
jgi:hypothetical protein